MLSLALPYRGRRSSTGFSIIELMIAITVIAIFIALGMPAFFEFLQNAKIRTAAESMRAGIQFAKSEALRRNTSVRFQLMTTLDSDCVANYEARNWVVSLDNANGKCNAAPSETDDPRILQKKSAAEGTEGVAIITNGPDVSNTLIFSGMGRLTNANWQRFDSVDFSNPAGGTCKHDDPSSGKMRCLRIEVSRNGDVRMCDPAVAPPVNTSDPPDPRQCKS